MTLHDAIAEILKEAGRPLSTREIADIVNKSGLYSRKDEKLIEKGQIRSRVKNYSKLFDYINGQVILTTDNHWKKLLTSYWYLADILRGYYGKSDLQFLLASLLFFKRLRDINNIDERYGIRVPNKNKSNLFYDFDFNHSESIFKELEHLDSINNSIGVFSDSSNLLQRLNNKKLYEIFSTLGEFETTEYNEQEFGPIFDYFLHHISIEFSNSTTPYTPRYLQELMVALLNPQPGKSLYDPVCGSGGLLIESLNFVNGNLNAKGTEINHRMTQLGYMNLVMNGFLNVDLKTTDCFQELRNVNTYDYIIGDLPLNGVYNLEEYYDLLSSWGINPSKSGKGYSAPVLFVLSKLAHNGTAVITVSESLLFKGGKEREIRELLIREDVLESVISLPHGALRPYTDAKSSILILNKNKPVLFRNKIKFIDSVSTYSDSKSMDINTDEVLALHLNESSQITDNFKVIENERLRRDFNLSVSTYSTESILAEEMLLSGKGVKLGEVVNIRSGTSPKKEDLNADANIPVFKIENLSKDILDLYLDLSSTNHKVQYQPKYRRSLLYEESVLIARIGDQLKPTYYKPTSENSEILFHSGLFALIPHGTEKEINLEYLYYQLHTEFVTDQIKKRRSGAVMPHISIAQLKEIVIPYMDIPAQSEFVASQKASIISSERAKIEERIKALGYEEAVEQKESDIVKTLVHQLRPTLLSIDMQVKTFKRIIEKHNLTEKREFDEATNPLDPELDSLINKPKNLTLGNLINRLESDTIHLNDVLTSVNKVMNFNIDNGDKVNTDLFQFIEDYVVSKQAHKKLDYTFEIKGKHVMLPIHQTSFREMLDQLILNAEKHGFSDRKKIKGTPKITFRIRKSDERQVVILEYLNNGKPYLLSKDDYIKAFIKSQSSDGSGIGGNYVNRVIKAHSGELMIEENKSSGFHMIIELPLKQYIEHE